MHLLHCHPPTPVMWSCPLANRPAYCTCVWISLVSQHTTAQRVQPARTLSLSLSLRGSVRDFVALPLGTDPVPGRPAAQASPSSPSLASCCHLHRRAQPSTRARADRYSCVCRRAPPVVLWVVYRPSLVKCCVFARAAPAAAAVIALIVTAVFVTVFGLSRLCALFCCAIFTGCDPVRGCVRFTSARVRVRDTQFYHCNFLF